MLDTDPCRQVSSCSSTSPVLKCSGAVYLYLAHSLVIKHLSEQIKSFPIWKFHYHCCNWIPNLISTPLRNSRWCWGGCRTLSKYREVTGSWGTVITENNGCFGRIYLLFHKQANSVIDLIGYYCASLNSWNPYNLKVNLCLRLIFNSDSCLSSNFKLTGLMTWPSCFMIAGKSDLLA